MDEVSLLQSVMVGHKLCDKQYRLQKWETVMDETTYHTWWALHLRAARGENLNQEERVTYEAGLRQMHQEEMYDQDVATLRQARATVAALEAEQAQWRTRREQLEAEIVTLEAALSERTRQLLGVKV